MNCTFQLCTKVLLLLFLIDSAWAAPADVLSVNMPGLIERAAGQPLKNIALSLEGRTVAGEMVLTQNGIEGGAVYAIGGALRDRLPCSLSLDLKPQVDLETLVRRLAERRRGRSLSAWLASDLHLSPLAYSLLREIADPVPMKASFAPLGDQAMRLFSSKTFPAILIDEPSALAIRISSVKLPEPPRLP